jgi:predicted GNAT family acetyltransferase
MSNTYLRVPEANLRPVMPGDEAAIAAYLERHWASTMLMRANLRMGGLVDQGHPIQGTYVAMWDGGTIESLAVHYGNGALVLHAPRALGLVVREAAAVSRRPVAALTGPWLQVETAATTTGIVERSQLHGTPQVLMTLELAKLGVPEAVIRENVRGRLAAVADIETLLPWRMARDAETYGIADTPATRATARRDMEEQVRVQGLYVAETNRLVAMASYDAWQPDAVQIGGVWVPAPLREKGYGAVAVAEAAHAAHAYGVPRATLVVEKSHRTAMSAYRALGFIGIGDYGMLAYRR